METFYLPIVPRCEAGAMPTISLVGAMNENMVPLLDSRAAPPAAALRRYAGGVVKLNDERAGNVLQQSDGSFVVAHSERQKADRERCNRLDASQDRARRGCRGISV